MSRFAAVFATLLLLAGAASAQQAESLRDPTRPLSYSMGTSTGPTLELQAILRRDTGAEAIVNGERVQPGSSVSGARIEAIGSHSITYSYRGERHRLRLRPTIRQ